MGKANKVNRDELLRDVSERQRSIVFPDTVQNEPRFWSNVISGKHPLKLFQVVGLLILVVALIVTEIVAMKNEWWAHSRLGESAFSNVLRVWGGQFIALFVFAVFLALIALTGRKRHRQ